MFENEELTRANRVTSEVMFSTNNSFVQWFPNLANHQNSTQ